MENKFINQCDGCRRKLPLIKIPAMDGKVYNYHIPNESETYDAIACTKDLYTEEKK